MDFGSLLHHAQRNGKDGKKEGIRCYNTKFEPPKKEQRNKQQLSVNIKKFLAKKEAEEKAKRLEANKKKEELLALRSKDKKATRRVNVMLKRTKSANQSVIQDAVDADNTSVTLAGPIQPDEDDYGYVSQEASAFYNKMMEKYSKMPDEPKFNLNKKKIVSTDLNSTKERVRVALEREREEALLPHKRKRKHKEDSAQKEDYTEKYEPEAEPSIPRKKPKLPAPPPINFNDLLKLAEKKQFEPIVIEAKPKEEEKLYTKKQKKEIEREREWRERKEGKLPPLESSKISTTINKISKQSVDKQVKTNTDSKLQKINTPNVELVRKTDKVDSPIRTQNLPIKKVTDLPKKISFSNTERNPMRENVPSLNNKTNFTSKNLPQKLKPTLNGKQKEFTKSNNREMMNKDLGKSLNNREPIPSKQKPKQFPPKDLKPKQFPPREFPPRDIKRKPLVNKRRILDEDEDYDSEMDDFIDDGPEEGEDYSKLISEIFKYDKSKYRNMDDDDDNMESTFAQQMREEVISTKIGIMEDLEDMKKEEEEKRRKAMTKRKYK